MAQQAAMTAGSGGHTMQATETRESAAGTCIQSAPVQVGHHAASGVCEHRGQISAPGTASQWLHSFLQSLTLPPATTKPECIYTMHHASTSLFPPDHPFASHCTQTCGLCKPVISTIACYQHRCSFGTLCQVEGQNHRHTPRT